MDIEVIQEDLIIDIENESPLSANRRSRILSIADGPWAPDLGALSKTPQVPQKIIIVEDDSISETDFGFLPETNFTKGNFGVVAPKQLEISSDDDGSKSDEGPTQPFYPINSPGNSSNKHIPRQPSNFHPDKTKSAIPVKKIVSRPKNGLVNSQDVKRGSMILPPVWKSIRKRKTSVHTGKKVE